MSFVQMTLSGGAFILFIVVVRALALHRLPKGAFLALWEMAALRLLLPFTIPLPFSLFAPAKHLPVVGDYLAAGGAAVPRAPAVGIPNGTPAQAGTAPGAVLPMVWLAGAALMAAYFTVSYVRARRRFRTSTPDDTPAVRRWLAAQRLHRPLEVRQSTLVSSPLTYGVLRPVILLPEDMERGDETALTYILTHEYIHIRRFDSVAKLVFAAVLCVHWFNPLAWVMYVLANRDLELSCDERVMNTLGGKEKASYALTLINMEETRSRCFSPYNHFSKLAIEERIEAIMKYKKASVLALALAVALVVGATTAFATSATGSQDQIGIGAISIANSHFAQGDYDLAGLPYDVDSNGERPMVSILENSENDNTPDVVSLEQLEHLDARELKNAIPMEMTLISVSHDDEHKFTPERWAEILELIEQGKVSWED